MTKKWIMGIVLFIIGTLSIMYFLSLNSPQTRTTIGLFTIINKGHDSDKWISATSESDVLTRITVTDENTWNEIIVEKKYSLYFRETKGIIKLVSIYPEGYSGRIE